jgi:hypothetical protein
MSYRLPVDNFYLGSIAFLGSSRGVDPLRSGFAEEKTMKMLD